MAKWGEGVRSNPVRPVSGSQNPGPFRVKRYKYLKNAQLTSNITIPAQDNALSKIPNAGTVPGLLDPSVGEKKNTERVKFWLMIPH